AALAPSFGLLLAFRSLQGLCMPGLLTAGVPYVAEAFVPRIGGRAMGYYVASLVAGGLIGRVGVALLADVLGWRWAIGVLAVVPWPRLRLALPAGLPRRVGGPGLVPWAQFGRLTAASGGGTGAAAVPRGAASSVYFSLYYGVGSLGGYLPGLRLRSRGRSRR